MYEARYDPQAEKQLEKLEKEVARRIVKKIKEVGYVILSIEEKCIKEDKLSLVLNRFNFL